MIHPLRMHYDKLLLAVALMAMGGSLDWVRRLEDKRLKVGEEAADTRLAATEYEATPLDLTDTSTTEWRDPIKQTSGAGLPCGIFTPPVIYRDPATGVFGVSPSGNPASAAAVMDFAPELLEVKRGPYRLQLVGYFGTSDGYLVAFTAPPATEPMLVRAGHRFAGLDLRFKSFEVRRVLVGHKEAGPVYEAAAEAVLHDERIQAEVVLDSRMRRFTDTPVAVIYLAGGKGRPCELRTGDSFAEAGSICRIESIQLEPAEVRVSRTTPGKAVPELLVMRPKSHPENKALGASSPPQPEAGLVARNER